MPHCVSCTCQHAPSLTAPLPVTSHCARICTQGRGPACQCASSQFWWGQPPGRPGQPVRSTLPAGRVPHAALRGQGRSGGGGPAGRTPRTLSSPGFQSESTCRHSRPVSCRWWAHGDYQACNSSLPWMSRPASAAEGRPCRPGHYRPPSSARSGRCPPSRWSWCPRCRGGVPVLVSSAPGCFVPIQRGTLGQGVQWHVQLTRRPGAGPCHGGGAARAPPRARCLLPTQALPPGRLKVL